MLNRTIAPEIIDAVNFNLTLKQAQHFVLKNGVEVYAIDAGAQEVLQLELVFFAGNSVEPQKTVAHATNFLLKNGTASRTAFQINEAFDYCGAWCSRACYNETATITLHTLSKHLPALLPVLGDMITQSVFSEEELQTFVQNSKQKLSVNLQKSDFVANRLIDAHIFGETHPYGKYNTAADYDALTTQALQQFFKTEYINGRCIIFVAGKLPQNIAQLLNQQFGELPLQNHRQVALPATAVHYATDIPQQLRITNDANGVQGSIRIARPFPNRHHPHYQPVMVLNTVFGGYFGSRLMANIREEKGYTYGIHSYLQNHIGPTSWLISTEAGRDVCEAAIAEVYKEMELLCNEPVDEEELLLVRNYMMGIILGDLDGPFQIINRWKNIVLNNLDEAYFYNSIDTIKTISAVQLQTLAQEYLQPKAFCELVVV
jgi:zinc protease